MSIHQQIKRATAGVAEAPAGFNPQNDITWHSLFWAEGSAFIAEGYSDTDNVTAWPNETGESAANNPSGSTRPYDDVNAAYNNQPTVFMNGVLTTDNFTTAPTYPVSIVIIGNAGTLNVDRLFFEGNDCSNRSQISATGLADHWRLYAGTIQDAATNSADTQPHLIVARYDGSTGADTLSADGVRQISGDAGSQTIDGVTLAGNCNQQNPLAGDLAFVGVYEGDVTSDTEWWNFLDWVETHYGISVVTGDAFNPESDITWHSLFWTEGTAFQALGYTEGDDVDDWPNETGEADAAETSGSAVSFDESNPSFNGQPVIDLAGGRRYGTANFTSAPTYPISLVAIGNTGGTGGRPFMDGNDCSNRAFVAQSSGAQWQIHAGTTQAGGTSDQNPHLFVATFDGSTGNDTLTVDGTTVIDADAGSQTIDGFRLGANCNEGSSSSGAWALFGIYEGDITADPNYDEFVAWVSRHYGVSAT